MAERTGGLGAIVTVPPYADFVAKVARHPVTVGLRLNTIMPLADPEATVLERLRAHGQPVWVDLKGRQIRVVEAALPPFTAVRISHRISCSLPAELFLSDGQEHARLVAIDGERLVLDRSPRRLVGPGESVNVIAPDLRIEGTLTATDRRWLRAMGQAGARHVMLSFVEGPEDAAEVRALLPEAVVVQKIESQRGLAHVAATGATHGRLLAARGDLYVELARPHQVLGAMRRIVQADPQAIAASRILGSLAWEAVPRCAELSDLAWLHGLGYRTVMLGDQVCQQRDSVLAALEVIAAVNTELGL